MGGVDLSDNLMVHFATARNRLKKYYKKVFRHMLDMAILNAFITYKGKGGKLVRREFILRLVEKIISAVEILVYLEKIYIEMIYISLEREFYELFNGVSCQFVSVEQK